MIDNDEVRRRRVERLAMLQRAQSESSAGSTRDATPVEQNKPVPPKPVQEPVKEPTKEPTKEPAKEPAKEPVKESVKEPKRESTNNIKREPKKRVPAPTSVASVFQIDEKDVPQDWPEALELGIDRILWDKITSGKVKPLLYLLGCYTRASKLPAETAKTVQDGVITMAFISASADTEDEVYDDFGQTLLNSSLEGSLNPEFVHQTMQMAADDEEAFHLLLGNVVNAVTASLEFGSPSTSAAFAVLNCLVEVPGAALILLTLPSGPFTPNVLSHSTFLGRVLSLGVSPDGLLKLHSQDIISSSSLSELAELARQTQPMIDLLNGCQFRLVEKLIRSGAAERRKVLDWFVAVLDINHGQMAMNRVPGKTNSLQLMMNSFKVLLRLADPFVKLDPSSLMLQLKKISTDYFAHKVSYSVSDETKTLASEDAPFNSRQLTAPPLNFVTECFFLCAGFLHFGFHATIQALDGSFKRQTEHLESQREAVTTDPQYRNMPPNLQRLAMLRIENYLRSIKAEYAGLYAEAHNTDLLGRVLRFSEFNLAFDVWSAEQCPASHIQIQVPWPQDPPDAFASFPEFLVEAPLASSSYILRSAEFVRDASMSMNNEILFDAAIFFMSSPKVLRNPYLRSKFVEILFYGGADIPLTSGSSMPGTLSTLFTTSDNCRKYLLPALMSVFIDIEHTGRSSQFYEKFSTRELVANVLKVIWRDPHYRNQLVTESEEKPDFFVKFVALLLNDATYLLDEALGKLLEVHKLQHDDFSATASAGNGAGIASTAMETDNGQNEGENEGDENDEDGAEEGANDDPAARLRTAERSAKNFLQLANSTMALLNTFTSTVPHIFATPEIIDRFAVMLNYNLAALVGPKCNQLKVKNPAELGFNPRLLLCDLVRVYLNLRNQPAFPKSLSKDERSYRDENFSKAYRLLNKFSLLSPIDLDNFSELAQKTREALKETLEEEEDFGDDIPDEFLDPLMYDMMNDPVTLPTSKINIDMSTIKTHLLSDPTDPFNRVPLKIEDVIPNTELKQQIDEFKRQKKEQRQQRKNQENQMDTS